MDVLRAAIPLTRVLLRAAEGKLDAVVQVRGGSRSAQVHIVGGRLVALDGVDGEPLGDTLSRLGAFDANRHRAALEREAPSGRVGAWLVAIGAAEAHAVRHALATQLTARLATLLRWPDLAFALAFERPNAACDADADLVVCVWAGLLNLARQLSSVTLASLSGEAPLQLTRLGTRIALALARDGSGSFERCLSAAEDEDAQAQRAVLRALGAAVESAAPADVCTLLLRKHREVRRRAGPHALLDLPLSARPEQARPALRRLARKLHPDRFQCAEAHLRSVSGEVMRALAEAERQLLTRAR